MKKMILLVLSIIMLVSLVAPVSAEEQSATITEEEAKELIQKAVEFNLLIHWKSDLYTSDDTLEIERSFYYYKGDLLGEHQLTIDIRYRLIVDESKLPGGSYKGLPVYARTIFADEIADDIYNTGRSSFYSGDIPMFHETDDGKLYIVSDSVAPEYVTFIDKWYDDVVDVVYSDDQKATVRYLINVGFDRENPMWIECNMIKTDDGWRIAKSPFTDMLRHEWDASDIWEPYLIPYNPSPSTGDVSGERVAVIGAVSLACIIPTACLMRRRRRNTF